MGVLQQQVVEFPKRFGAALLTPLRFSLVTGHFLSSILRRSVSRRGEPLPWYTYPIIDFLEVRAYEDRTVLEFGAGASTLWWARRAKRVLALEGDARWAATLKRRQPPNADVRLVDTGDPEKCLEAAEKELSGSEPFDVVVVDGLFRRELLPLACRSLAAGGAIICDNSEGYGFREWFAGREFARADFFGYCPGLFHPHCTSIFWRDPCFLFDPRNTVPRKHAE